ncbi:MAG: hypothetical protein Q9218_001609 [Villophora microphyllina]
MVHKIVLVLTTAISLSIIIPLVLAHEHSGHGEGGMDAGASMTASVSPMALPMASHTASAEPQPLSPTYFTHPDYSGLMLAHIGLMTVAWFFVLPICVVLSVARSRLALTTQIAFSIVNALGLLLGTIYNSKTPKLYGNNVHHKLGWTMTWVVLAQLVVGLLRMCANGLLASATNGEERTAFVHNEIHDMAGYQQMHPDSVASMHRYSHDSGHGTESESSRSNSLIGIHQEKDAQRERFMGQPHGHYAEDVEARRLLGLVGPDGVLVRLSHLVPRPVTKILNLFYDAVDVLILVFGFILILSGFITYGGVFHGRNIFNGLAHAIKGGIFFWYGLLTLGRWMGCFAEYGWAWNIRPPGGMVSSGKAKVPSAEFVESFVIFLYGSTNVFLEHLAAWGNTWTAQDLEHVSISIMFFGGGLCGMLVESRKIRDLLNASLSHWNTSQGPYSHKEQWAPPKTYSFSMNPFPALIVLLLGLMMSSHHQHSMVSTMVHKQWGSLFVGFALARAVTYLLTYLSPPTSYLPSRPPSEIIASFCLISGGLIFIASNKDTVGAMERHNLNAMFVFTVTMGSTAFLMAWEMIVLAVKGWAMREKQPAFHSSRVPLASHKPDETVG